MNLNQRSANYSQQAGHTTHFVNKVLLEHSLVCLGEVCLCIIYGGFLIAKIELSSCNRESMAHKPAIFTIWPVKKICQSLTTTL